MPLLRRLLFWALIAFTGLALVAALGVGALYLKMSAQLPEVASLRSEWVLQEDFIDAGVATATIGTYEWTLTDTGSAT